MATSRKIIVVVMLLLSNQVFAQLPDEQSTAISNNLEFSNAANLQLEDDATWQTLNSYRRHALALNTAEEAELQALGLLTVLQIDNLLQYRSALGPLISLYELQAIPGFDMATIQKLLPYVSLNDQLGPQYSLHDYLQNGDHNLLLRYGRKPEKAKGYETHKYKGSPDKLFLRYRYSFPKYISAGVLMEKDPGEPWLVKSKIPMFDFYSVHVFLKNFHRLKALAVGDFTVNLGQGLLVWQSHAYQKGASAMLTKREGEILRPYTSAGEFNFFRGLGATCQLKNWSVTAFASLRFLDAAIDSTDIESIIAGNISTSGYHRTATELANRQNVRLLSIGGNIKYTAPRWHVGLNLVNQTFSPALLKVQRPYNKFDFTGSRLIGGSIDFAGYYKNVHFFGEAATNDNLKSAFMIGAITTIAPTVDLSLVYRSFDKEYHSLFTNSFGNGYQTANERGCYTAMAIRLSKRFTIESYSDIYYSPWLKYQKSAPSRGTDYSISGIYTPDKLTVYRLRYIYQTSQQNQAQEGNNIPALGTLTKMNLRFDIQKQLSKSFKIKGRIEYCQFYSMSVQHGGMCFLEAGKGINKVPFYITARIAYFKTENYDTRIYATESSVLYDNSVTQFYGTGWQFYMNLKWKVNRRITCWARFHQTRYPELQKVGSGNEEVNSNHITNIQFQLQYLLAKKN
ncbi:helix-hairpin-helix domain-containing protein [Chitinophaga silvatica]|uniref:Helix-hairpin-helix domain-containing protein n=1 Tax=Chitinophaga silvatica TaxID=2282649 RepID=A0A3E1Y7F5_9BACT|nr:helix-hairpin-helix domain-containing protein [Chitinophaga silvatica]RFS21007.1 helix-hairpin-helix domain-containing protein [Chitinophaga silvatica]